MSDNNFDNEKTQNNDAGLSFDDDDGSVVPSPAPTPSMPSVEVDSSMSFDDDSAEDLNAIEPGPQPAPTPAAPEEFAADPASAPVVEEAAPTPPPVMEMEQEQTPAPAPMSPQEASAPAPEAAPAAEAPSEPAAPAPAPQPQGGGGDNGKPPVRIGDRLIELGVITEDQLQVALQEKKLTGKMLGQVFVDLGFVTEAEISSFMAEKSGIEKFDANSTIVDSEVLERVPREDAERYQVLPVSMKDNTITIAMADPEDVVALDVLRRFFDRGVTINPIIANPTELMSSIDKYYGYASSIDNILKELEQGYVDDDIASLSENEAYAHPIVRLVNALVSDAVKLGVSDLHFEPEENFIRLRYRLDGVLRTAQTLHGRHWGAIAQRLKIMSKMNIADKLAPQDGRFSINVGGREIDFRVSSLPTVFGENIVLRVLDKSAGIVPLEKLGFSDKQKEMIANIQSKPEGIVIVTGPTGSGKTTTLYSMLNAINTVDVNIQTLEDPVEFSLPMIRQTNIREGILEFADGIKALLRQDPDIIFVGEIRDSVTAEMALKAAMTGHQVYSSLHTNDSFGALPRLWDLGLKPSMMAGAMNGVFAQRLARRLCESCKQPTQATPEECKILEVDAANPPTIFKAGRCDACDNQGYKGRVAVIEILTFSEDMNDLMSRSASLSEIRDQAYKDGFVPMLDDGLSKVLDGTTSLEALGKVVSLRRR